MTVEEYAGVEIKQALKCCFIEDRCTNCPFLKPGGCDKHPAELAIDYINQLEEKLKRTSG